MRFSPAASVAPSKIRAIATLAEEHPGTLRLFYGEDTLPTPDFLKAAGQKAISDNKTFYTPNAGYPELRREIAAQVRRLHGVEVDPVSEVVVTASGTTALLLSIQATVSAGDSALVLTPLWPNITAAIRVAGAEAIEVPLGLTGSGDTLAFQPDFAQLEAAIKPNTKLLAIASPGNPTAWTATQEDWVKLVEFCQRHDLWLLADGVYERIIFDGTVAPSPLNVPGARERLIVAQSFSKAYRMTGWRVGYVIAPQSLARTITNLQEFVVSHAPGVAQETARVALIGGEAFVRESQARYARHAQIALERLRAIDGVEVPRPTGAFYVFPKLDDLTDSYALCESLVIKHKLGLAPGAAFGAGGEGHIRLCFAVDEATLNEAIDRFERAWKGGLGRG